MSYPTISRDYWRNQRTHRSCREAFGSDLERDERWAVAWNRAIVAFCIVAAIVVIPLIALGVL